MRCEELMTIAQQATFLAERSTDQWVPDQGAAQQAAAQSRLERWCQLAAGGDWTQFTERLAWDALDRAQARRLLTDGQHADWREPPAWTTLLAEAVAQCEAVAVHDPAVLMNPFVSVAQARLQQAVGAQWLWLTPAVQAKLIDYLCQQLVDLAAPTLTYNPLLIWGKTRPRRPNGVRPRSRPSVAPIRSWHANWSPTSCSGWIAVPNFWRGWPPIGRCW